jgi:hypothetical protein
VRIRGSSFRMIPNPTGDLWLKLDGPKPSWRISGLMEDFEKELKLLTKSSSYELKRETMTAQQYCDILSSHDLSHQWRLGLDTLEAIHGPVDTYTQYLLSVKQAYVLMVFSCQFTKLIGNLDNPQSTLSRIVISRANTKEEGLMAYYFEELAPAVIKAAVNELGTDGWLISAIWLTLIFECYTGLFFTILTARTLTSSPRSFMGAGWLYMLSE